MSKVYLVGAGPGDPGLLTLRGRELLARADVVVYDYLANQKFLDFCSGQAELIYAGKKGGQHTLSQGDINSLLVEKASQGLEVVRLKGGDPYVFGRGAEEAEELVESGIEFEVVPGVTSAVAAFAYAGIPLTHRKYASSLSMVTGHEDANKKESTLNWSALAESASTLVFFMGVKNLAAIARNLIQAGMPEDKPAALVRWGTTCRQQTLCASLQDIAWKAEQHGISPPALFLVGEVARLRQTLNWFEKRPMLGQGVIVTRAREQASSLLALLEELGACCYQFPTIRIQELQDYSLVDQELENLANYQWVIFTSVNGVSHFWRRLLAHNMDSRSLGGCKVAAIGPATADRLRQEGIEPDFVPDKYVAEHVLQGLLQRGIQGCRVLIPRAETAREVLPRELEQAGAEVRVLPVYRTVLAGENQEDILQALHQGEIQFVTFTSSSTVHNFFQLIPAKELANHVDAGLRLACIGPITAKSLEEYGFQADILPQEYTIQGLVQALEQSGEG
ncbi:MAG: uroporphyrinogen-III C-methyltransferase [Thermodesulfobacteriota bacterium]